VQHPVRAFLRQRLGIRVSERDDELDDALPVDLDALEQWGVGDRLLLARLGGAELAAAVAAERGRGLLPPGALAGRFLPGIEQAVERLVALAATELDGLPPPITAEVRVPLPDGRILTGAVPGVRGDVVASISFSRLRPPHRLAAWVRLLALAAAHPGRRLAAVTIGRRRGGGASGATASISRLELGEPAAALAELAALVDLHERGLREPLPLYCATSAAYAAAVAVGRDGEAAAAREWTTTPGGFPQEDRNPEHLLALGGVVPFADLVAPRPGPDESWTAVEATRFGAYARRLFDPLLAAETLTDA
jgi:exodeoxyribonuclease V gamma subunit